MNAKKSKTVMETAIQEHTYKVFPNDLNSTDTVFGGLIMATLDRLALVVAERHSESSCVTVSVDAVHFLAPAKRGDILLFSLSLNHAWRTSMEIGARVAAEDYRTGKRRHILSAYFTFVAIDKDNNPVEVPGVIPKTNIEKRRYDEASDRRERRFQEAKERKARRAKE